MSTAHSKFAPLVLVGALTMIAMSAAGEPISALSVDGVTTRQDQTSDRPAAAQDEATEAGERGAGWSRDRRGELRDRLREHFDRRGDARGLAGDGRPAFMPDTLTDQDLAEVVAVAREISPEWGDKLGALLESDPEALRESVTTKARRIWLLVELKRQRPPLYRIRVAEIRLQGRMRELVREHREAKAAGDETLRADLEAEIRDAAEQAVDLQLRGRAEELAAMAEAVDRMLADLTLEGRQRDERIERLVQVMLAGGRPGRGRDGSIDSSLSTSRVDPGSDAGESPARSERDGSGD